MSPYELMNLSEVERAEVRAHIAVFEASLLETKMKDPAHFKFWVKLKPYKRFASIQMKVIICRHFINLDWKTPNIAMGSPEELVSFVIAVPD